MDPDTCLREILKGLLDMNENDPETVRCIGRDVRNRLYDLADWIEVGGFAPNLHLALKGWGYGDPRMGRKRAKMNQPTDEEIAKKAYDLYLTRERNKLLGTPQEDWIQAKKILSDQLPKVVVYEVK
jgi:hypothetical protein